jgi:hypothetical protein
MSNMKPLSLKEALSWLLVETHSTTNHSQWARDVHSVVKSHLSDIEVASKEAERLCIQTAIGPAERFTAKSIQEANAYAFEQASNNLNSLTINPLLPPLTSFNQDVVNDCWPNAKFAKVHVAMEDKGIHVGDIFWVERVDLIGQRVWVNSSDDFKCWLGMDKCLPYDNAVNVTSLVTIRARKEAYELEKFRKKLKIGDNVKFWSSGKVVSDFITCFTSTGRAMFRNYCPRLKSGLYPVDYKGSITEPCPKVEF